MASEQNDKRVRRWDLWVLAVASVIFFLSSSVLSFGPPFVFNSPDENANAVFSLTMAHDHRLFLVEPLNFELRNLLHPRSVVARLVSATGFLAPGSFLGLPLFYGLAITILPEALLRFLTPLLAVLALFAWRRIVEVIFKSRHVALIATLALMFHPAFWYYTARSMMHNVPFVCFLIFAVYFLVCRRRRSTTIIASAVCLALAIWFRTVEAIWILPLTFMLLMVYRHRFTWNNLLLFAIMVFLTLFPMLHFNWQAYGNAWTNGYTFHQSLPSFSETSTVGTEASAEPFTPFSFDWPLARHHLRIYAFDLFPWMSLAALIGMGSGRSSGMGSGRSSGLIFKVKVRKPEDRPDPIRDPVRTYLIITVLVTFWLWFFYGSWSIHDNPDPTLATIGTSYVRYWLPMFVLVSPFVGEAIVWIGKRFSRSPGLVVGVLSLLLCALNIRPVFFAEDGLLSIRQNLFAYAASREAVVAVTETNAIVIVDRADKFLWPERRVVYPLRSEETYAAMPTMIQYAPLYYFGISFPPTDIDYLNNEKLAGMGLRVDLVETIGEESLYRIEQAK